MAGGVAFGENDSYLFFCGEGVQQQFWAAGLPVSMQKYFDGGTVKEIFQAALGLYGSYYMYFRNQAGKCHHVYDQLPPELTTWIESWTDGAKQPDRDFASLQISLGPNKSFFAFDKNSRRYHNLPTRFEVILQASPSDILPAGWAPSYVTLGPMGSYILRNTRGGRSSTLFPTTHGLKNFIQSPKKPGIVKVTLSPSDCNNYVVTSSTGACTGVVPLKASQDFVLFSLKWATCHPAVTEATHKVVVDKQQAWIHQYNTLLQENAILKSPARTAKPPAQTVNPAAQTVKPAVQTGKPAAQTVKPAAPKKSASETFAKGLGIANGMVNLIMGIENLERNQNNQNNQNYQYN